MLKTERNAVRSATEQELDRFLRYPARKVIGVVDTLGDLEAALSALGAAGFKRGSIQVFSGEEGLRCIDPRGEHHGLLGRLIRISRRSARSRSTCVATSMSFVPGTISW
jgi:hypothetical protein